jgi:hypothetical protein
MNMKSIFLLIVLAIGYASGVRAETFVRSAPAADGLNATWERPADVKFARTLRAGALVWVPIGEIAMTAVIFVCKDDPDVTAGSITPCDTRASADGKSNNVPKSSVYSSVPPQPTAFPVKFRWNDALYSDGTPISDLAGYDIFVKRQDCNSATLPGCAAQAYPNDPIELDPVNTYTVEGCIFRCCVTIRARNEARDVGPISAEACGPKKTIGPVAGLRVE